MVCVGFYLGLRWVSFGLFTDAFLLVFLQASECHFSDGLLFFRCDNLRTISCFDPAIGAAQANRLRALRSHFLRARFRVASGRLPSRLSPLLCPLVFRSARTYGIGIATRVSRAKTRLRDRLVVAGFSSCSGRRSQARGSCE